MGVFRERSQVGNMSEGGVGVAEGMGGSGRGWKNMRV